MLKFNLILLIIIPFLISCNHKNEVHHRYENGDKKVTLPKTVSAVLSAEDLVFLNKNVLEKWGQRNQFEIDFDSNFVILTSRILESELNKIIISEKISDQVFLLIYRSFFKTDDLTLNVISFEQAKELSLKPLED